MSSKRRLRRLEERDRRRQLLSQRCRCGKVRAENPEQARKLIALIQDYNGGQDEVRVYCCYYGGWHWTRRLEAPTLKEAS